MTEYKEWLYSTQTCKIVAMSKSKPTKKIKVKLQPFRTLGQSGKWYMANFGKLLLLTIIITLPASFLRTDPNLDFGLVGSIAGLFLLLVLALVSLAPNNLKLSLAKLYNLASQYFLRAIGVLLVLIVLLVAVTMTLSVATLAVAQISGLLGIALGLLALVTAGFFLYFLVRMSLAGVVLVDTDSRVVGSFKQSLRLTKKRFWKLLWAWTVLLIVVVVVTGVVLQALLFVPVINTSETAINIANGLLLTLVLPLIVRSVVSYYQKLTK